MLELQILLIFTVALGPSLLTLLTRRQAEARARSRLRSAMEASAFRGLPALSLSSTLDDLNGIGLPIGDQTCRFNARSSYIRCAVNPSGPCENCRHYQLRQ